MCVQLSCNCVGWGLGAQGNGGGIYSGGTVSVATASTVTYNNASVSAPGEGWLCVKGTGECGATVCAWGR